MNEIAIEIEQTLRDYIACERLDGDDSDLTSSTPLLAWGVLDSLSVVELMVFIEQRFGVAVPASEVTATNLETLRAITDMVVRLGRT